MTVGGEHWLRRRGMAQKVLQSSAVRVTFGEMSVKPPRAQQRPVTRVVHGIVREDPYAWLRDDKWQEVMQDPSVLTPEIRAHLEAENAWTDHVLSPTEALQAVLFDEMKGRIKQDDSSVPSPDGAWAYYARFREGGQHPTYCRRPRDGGDEQILLDGDQHASGKAYFNLGAVEHAYDHGVLGFSYDDKGSEFYDVHFKDLATGQLLPDRLHKTNGDFVWFHDGKTVLYTELDDNHRPCRVRRHTLGQELPEDPIVYEEKDTGFFIGLGLAENRQHAIISVHDHTTSEVYLLDAHDASSRPRVVEPRVRDVEYDVGQHEDTLIIRTNADGAEDFKIVTAKVATPGREHWTELVPHRPGCLILAAVAHARHLVRLEREGGLPRIVVRRMSDGAEHAIAFDEEAYALGLIGGYEYDTDKIRFSYSSMTTPSRVYEYDMETRERVLLKEQEIPSGHDPANYRSARIQAPAPDGELVPVSVLWHKDTPIDGSAPLVLYGYGSYGIAMTPGFETARLSLVDRGFVYAIAHVRGGMEKGYAWYRRGKLMQKKNTFSDFIAAGQALCEKKFTRQGQITAYGGSAGGMLVGAVVNMAPVLFRAAVAIVPFVDVVNTICDDTLPLTPPEWPEWGNPIENREAYAYIASYSPYDNVRAGEYPHILAIGGLTDPRVTYWEPAKWVARLRERKTDDRLLLLKTYMEAGHGGASGRLEKLRELAMIWAFILLAYDRVPHEPNGV